MNNISMILRVFAIIAAVAATTLYFLGKGKLEEKQTQLNATQATLQTTEADLATAKQDISRLDNRLKAESEALAKSKQELEGVRSEVYTARQEVSRTQQQLGQARNQISELEQAANKLRTDLVEAEQMLASSASLKSEAATLQTRVRDLESANANLQTELEQIKSSAEMIAARPAGATGNRPGTADTLPSFTSISQETQIESIRAKDGLIVLRALPKLNLAAGQTLKLSANMKPVGSVEIFEVSDSMALAHILPGANARGLREGDTVSLYR